MVRSVLADGICQQYADEHMLKRAAPEVRLFSLYFCIFLGGSCAIFFQIR